MEKNSKHFRAFVILFISSLLLFGCTKDEDKYDLDIKFNITIVPEGAGSVNTRSVNQGYGFYGIELTAIPSEGFTFSHWEGTASTPCRGSSVNPCTYGVISSNHGPTYTARSSAVFEEIVE